MKTEKAIDYTKLHNFLEQQKWQEANEETANIIFQGIQEGSNEVSITGEKIASWWEVQSPDVLSCPCEVLHTIDQLWVKYSQGHFGFSVQKKILQGFSLPYPRDWDKYGSQFASTDFWQEFSRDWDKFGYCVGWKKEDHWIDFYSDVTFDLYAPQGHLPLRVLAMTNRAFYPSSLLGRIMDLPAAFMGDPSVWELDFILLTSHCNL